MEEIRSEIVKISQKPENKIDTTLSSQKLIRLSRQENFPCLLRENTAPFPEAAFLYFIPFHLLSFLFLFQCEDRQFAAYQSGKETSRRGDT
ncbi:MAG: hypothetical protein ACLUIQ_05320 [Dialister invisus]